MVLTKFSRDEFNFFLLFIIKNKAPKSYYLKNFVNWKCEVIFIYNYLFQKLCRRKKIYFLAFENNNYFLFRKTVCCYHYQSLILSRQVRQCLANLNFFPMPFILTLVLCRKVCTSKERIKVHLIPSTKWKIQMFDLHKHNRQCYWQARPWPQCNYSIMRKHTLKNKQINNGKN